MRVPVLACAVARTTFFAALTDKRSRSSGRRRKLGPASMMQSIVPRTLRRKSPRHAVAIAAARFISLAPVRLYEMLCPLSPQRATTGCIACEATHGPLGA